MAKITLVDKKELLIKTARDTKARLLKHIRKGSCRSDLQKQLMKIEAIRPVWRYVQNFEDVRQSPLIRGTRLTSKQHSIILQEIREETKCKR